MFYFLYTAHEMIIVERKNVISVWKDVGNRFDWIVTLWLTECSVYIFSFTFCIIPQRWIVKNASVPLCESDTNIHTHTEMRKNSQYWYNFSETHKSRNKKSYRNTHASE